MLFGLAGGHTEGVNGTFGH